MIQAAWQHKLWWDLEPKPGDFQTLLDSQVHKVAASRTISLLQPGSV